MNKIKGQVKIPDHPKWDINSEKCKGDEHPCIVCGKPIKNPFDNPKQFFLRLGPGGKSYAIPEDTPDQGGAEMGCNPVGPCCLNKHPELKPLAFKMKSYL